MKKDYINNNATIYLLSDGIQTDSLYLKNIDFSLDSLVNYDDKYWHYMFSECTSCLKVKWIEESQYIFLPVNKKLHLSMVLKYRTGHEGHEIQPLNPEVIDTNYKLSSIKEKYVGYNEIVLDRNFFNGNQMAQEIFYVYHSIRPNEDTGIVKNYKIEFDKDKLVFFNRKESLTALCQFSTPDGDIKKQLNNQEILFLDFYGDCMAYYNGKWYSYLNFSFISMEIFKSPCPDGCVK